jgi:hypothetical protein
MQEAVEEPLQLNQEEIKQLSRLLAEAFVQQMPKVELTVITCVSGYEIIREDQIAQVVNLDLIASATHGWTDILGQIADFIWDVAETLFGWVVGWIREKVIPAITGISDWLSTVLPQIGTSLGGVASFIADKIMSGLKTISDFFTVTVPSYFKSVSDFFGKTIPSYFSIVTDFFTKTVPSLFKTVTDFFSITIPSLFKIVTDFFTKTIPDLFKMVTDFFTKTVPDLFKIVLDFFTKTMPELFKIVTDFFTKTVPELFKPVVDFFSKTLPTLFGIVVDFFSKTIPALFGIVVDFFTKTIPSLFGMVVDFFTKTMPSLFGVVVDFFSKTLPSLFSVLTDFFTKTIPSWITGISKGVTDLINLLVALPSKAPEIVRAVATAIYEKLIVPMYEGVKTYIINPLASGIQNMAGLLNNVGVAFQGFVNGIFMFPQWFKDSLIAPFTKWFEEFVIEKIFVKIESHVPYYSPSPQTPAIEVPKHYIPTASIRWGLPVFPDLEVLSDPFRWLANKIVNALSGWVDWLWGAIQGVFNALVNAVKGIAEAIWNAVTGVMSFIGESVVKGVKSIWDFFVKKSSPQLTFFYPAFVDFIHGVYDPLHESTAKEANEILKPQFEDVIKHYAPPIKIDEVTRLTINTWGVSLAFMTVPFWGQIPVRLGSWVMKALSKWLSGLDWKVRINLRPFGLGVDTEFNFAKAIGATIYDIAVSLKEWLDEIGRGTIYGYAIWFSRPISKVLSMSLRNFIPVELPREDVIMESLRRAMPLKDFEDRHRMASYFLAIQGYSDYVIDSWLKPAKDLNIKVTDRFGTARTVPLALMYELPSASDVATMMVRDIFATIDDFQRLYSARGMHPDIGALYYFLRFRYPPPERLWQFTVRGVSGLLWATLPDAEKADIKKEAEPIGATMPVAPETMNFKSEQLLTAFKTYMKWHDYARFSWIKDFPSDNLIYIDTLAEVPTKIDQRWMVKWGIYELLSAKQVTYTSSVKDFTKIMEATPTSAIQMDLTNFSRTVLATGLHPDWVPATAVAEAMNVLTEERTALRTGFMGLFKEGFYDIKALDTMLAGFIKTSFQVAYFDMTKMQWTTGWVNIPVMYLPPERKLLQLRALMDRSLDILREVQRDISNAYQEYIFRDYQVYKSRLTQVIEKINEYFAEDYKAITGTELPEDLELKFVEAYHKPYVEALQVWRDAFTIRRIRMWTQRWLGWVMYRVAYGVVEKEDIEKLITYVSDKAKLTDQETEFIRQVMDIMYGIATRSTVAEYLPTPSTLATLSEYITLDTKLVKEVLSNRGLDKEWQNIWLTYITVKPIKADAKALLSTYVRAFRYGVIPKEVLDKYVKEIPEYGFTEKEIQFIKESINLEEQIIEARASKGEYIPTPITLATICEYLPEAREFYDDVVVAKRIPKEWQELWARYIDIRPLVDDIKRYVSNAEALYVRFMTKKADFEKILKEANTYLGYTSKETEFLMKVTEFERYRNAWTELVGSVERLVSLSEYSPRASKYALGKLYEMIDALPLTLTEKAELKAMWEEYIHNRPVKAEAKTYITQLINAYVEGLISDDVFKKELQEMAKWGFSADELTFYEAQAALRKARKWKIPIGE